MWFRAGLFIAAVAGIGYLVAETDWAEHDPTAPAPVRPETTEWADKPQAPNSTPSQTPSMDSIMREGGRRSDLYGPRTRFRRLEHFAEGVYRSVDRADQVRDALPFVSGSDQAGADDTGGDDGDAARRPPPPGTIATPDGPVDPVIHVIPPARR